VGEHDFTIENHIQVFNHSCISLLDFLLQIMLLPTALSVNVELGGKNIRLRVLENRVLRKVFRCKREDLTGDERKLHNEELRYYLLLTKYSVYQIRRTRWAGHVARMEDK